MPQVRSLLRVVLIVAAAIVLSTCAHTTIPSPHGKTMVGPCASGTGSASRSAPVVCVDDTGTTLRVTPDPLTVFDKDSAGMPVMIHWYTMSGATDLSLQIAPGCVTDYQCDGSGHCSARTVPKATAADVQCKYDVWTQRQPKLDPVIILTECC